MGAAEQATLARALEVVDAEGETEMVLLPDQLFVHTLEDRRPERIGELIRDLAQDETDAVCAAHQALRGVVGLIIEPAHRFPDALARLRCDGPHTVVADRTRGRGDRYACHFGDITQRRRHRRITPNSATNVWIADTG